MRRLYVTNMATYQAHRHKFSTHLTTYWIALVDNSLPNWQATWEAAGKPIVVTTELLNEHTQDTWEAHPEVTVLPHPTFQGTMQMSSARGTTENADNTMDGIEHLSAIGIQPHHTVVDVHAKLAQWHPAYKLRMGVR